MIKNLFSKCPICGSNIEADSKGCSSCSAVITSSFHSISENSYAKLLGELAVKNNIFSKDEFMNVYDEYLHSLNTDSPKKIEDLIIEKNLIPLDNLSKLIAGTLRAIDKQFCSIAVKAGLVSDEDAKEALNIQNKFYKAGNLKSIGDILEEKGKIAKDQIIQIFESIQLDKGNETREKKKYKPLKQIWEEDDKKNEEIKARQNLPARSLKIARLGVKHNFITQDEFDKALQDWSGNISSEDENKDFLSFLMEKDILDKKKLTILSINFEYDSLKELDLMFCKLALIYKYIDEKTAEEALKNQNIIFKEKHKLLSIPEILFKQKKITGKQVYRILREQKRNELAKTYYEKLELDKKETEEKNIEKRVDTNGSLSTENIKIDVSDDALKAVLHPVPSDTELSSIKLAAQEKGIIFGLINDDLIKSFIDEGTGSPIILAYGKPPVEPVHAEIKCHFTENYLNVGSIDSKGNIDFKNRGEVPFVEEGQLLAQKIPLVQGKTGVDVFGSEIIVQEAIDLNLEPGQGTKIEEDPDKIYAAEKGKPHIALNGKISVYNIHEINGDVDYRTGHIEFNGNIRILGTVKPGFKVKGNDIEVDEIEDGVIESKGHVIVKGGISGGKIFAEQGLNAKFVSQSEINAFGDVSVEKEILESEIRTSGIFTTSAGKIIDSTISAKGGIEARQVGTDVSDPSFIEMGSSHYLKKLMEPLLEKEEKLNKKTKELDKEKDQKEKEHKEIHQEIAEKAQIHDKANQALEQLSRHYDQLVTTADDEAIEALKLKVDDLEQKVKDYDNIMENLFDTQDAYLNILLDLNNEIDRVNSEKETIVKDIKALKIYDSSIPPSPVLVVHGTIEKGTRVIGPNSAWKVNETTKNIKAFEIKTRDQDGNEIHLVKVEKLR